MCAIRVAPRRGCTSSAGKRHRRNKDELKAIRFKLSDWFNISVATALLGAVAFSLSWLYVRAFSSTLNLDLFRYFEPVDYLQAAPIWVSTFILGLALVYALLSSIQDLVVTFGGSAQVFRTIVLTLWPLGICACLAFVNGIARDDARAVRRLPPSIVCLKGDHPALKGNVLFELNRYLLVYGENRALFAIPQTEIQSIQTPRGQIRPPKLSISKETLLPGASFAK